MKKIIVFCISIFILLMLGSNINKNIQNNKEIANDFEVLFIEKEFIGNVIKNLESKYENINYGLFIEDEERMIFYTSKDSSFDQLYTNKEVIIKDISQYDESASSIKFGNIYFNGTQTDIKNFLNEFNEFLVSVNNMTRVESRINGLENVLFSVSRLPIYLYSIIILALFLTSLTLLYTFIHFNNKSKSIAIKKLYGTVFIDRTDIIFITIAFCFICILNLYASIFLLLMLSIYLIKYFLYYKCIVIESIKGKLIINKFETLIIVYNSVMKFLILGI